MSNTPVALVKCDSYEYEEVKRALDESLDLINALDFVKPGMKIGIKANLVTGSSANKAITTHPVLLRRLCELITERGASVVIGDSPGGLYTQAFVQNVYKSCGLHELESSSVTLNTDFSIKDGKFPEAESLKSFIYTGWLDDVDAIIGFSKLKTHAMMGMSCAVKNMFGCIPGTTKPDYHMRFPEEKAFANVMVDLNEFFKPVLYIVDAIDGMEGNGPTAGEKRHIGAILASKRPYSLDMVCAHMIGMGINDVQTLLVANERGLGPKDISEVSILGSYSLEDAKIPDFKRATIHQSITFEGGSAFNRIKSIAVKLAYSTKPLVKKDECIGCKKCHDTCPAKAITMIPSKGASPKGTGYIPQIDRSKCIKCFCCQEFCPVGAMKVHYNPIGSLLNKMQR
ncbi:MAG: DUF362 domain-containing protein [Butyrivibrio sp.]|uniref:DUF362 domain-containing protein n=1 Tax=Butyrivibrio sp. TaxID=28121 RepID=UPI001B6702A5|nr:DUF362 domain-containing protein [Butyrivibrio sp.]MBP3280119.1 DUF362 domain-containing protein [Butyrivibrio sp.]MBP3781754.1 DUF362 domain-containing protein [Butyrivibrio sp.]MBP3813537.1 DUF362 domain-containing protein [Butyrivibrio sp.]